MTDTTTDGNLYAQAAEIANRIERASIVAHWASPADAEYHAERARTAFCEMAALLGYTVSKVDPVVTVSDYNAVFDPADDAFGGAFKDGFREGWLFAQTPDFERREEFEEEYGRSVDIAPSECWDAYRSHYFAMLPLAALPDLGSALKHSEAQS